MKKHLRIDVAEPTFFPPVLKLLRELPSSLLYHQKYPFRHPAAIYFLSILQLAGDFNRLLSHYAALRNRKASLASLQGEICQSERILIYSLREHLDDCQMILMCFVDPSKFPSKGKSPDDTLKAAGFKEQSIFWDGVAAYADSYLMPLVNKLKHSQGRFRATAFDCAPNDFRVGFYLEEVDGKGVAQPSLTLHRGNSAFSFSRDIRANVAFVYRVGQALNEAIEAFLRRVGDVPVPSSQDYGSPDQWRNVCLQAAKLDAGVFPQELKSRFVRFSVDVAGTLQIRELDRDQHLSFPKGNVPCTTVAMPDGMSSYRMPYHPLNSPTIK
jgi:hypothetical protein